jgi:signal peptidase II
VENPPRHKEHAAASRRTDLLVALGLAVAVFILDQSLKAVVEVSMRPGEGIPVIPGGAAGNLLDRLTDGEVTDYVHFSFWYVFNAADAAITVGVAILLLAALRPERDDQPPVGSDQPEKS